MPQTSSVLTPSVLTPSALTHELVCIIPHYGPPALTLHCLHSLMRGTVRPQILVICNGNGHDIDSLVAAMQHEYPFLRVARPDAPQFHEAHEADMVCITLAQNKGFAVACNEGLRFAAQNPATRYAWLLNNDTTVAPDAAETLIHCLQAQPKALCGTSVLRANAPDRLELALGCRFSPLTTIITPCSPNARPEEVCQTPVVDYIYGASFAFPLTVLDDVGFLDERFFLYYEEHDFCRRAKHAGYALHWCRNACVWHGHKAQDAPPDPKVQAAHTTFKHHHETVSTVRFLQKHHPSLLIPALLFRTICKVIKSLLHRDLAFLQTYLRALINSL